MNLKQVPHVVIETGGEKIVKDVEQVKVNRTIEESVREIVKEYHETEEEFIYQLINPYCEEVLEKKLSKKDLKRIIIRGNKPRAHWIFKFNPSDGIHGYYCENCDKPRGQIYDDYCAYCGAEMIKEVTND